jgi:uroporphyrinogen-III synthase
MRIIITRPEEDAAPLAAKLSALGHVALVMPLIKIVARQKFEIPKRNYQFICLTSANGIRVLNDVSELQSIPVIAVGPQSMRAAELKKFSTISMQGGDVVGITRYIIENVNPLGGPLLYVSGSETSGDLEGRLKSADYDVDRVITYDAVPVTLTPAATQADVVLLYSPRTAKLWRQSIEELSMDVSHMKHICLSANVAANLPQSWNTRIAAHPTEDAILQVLD